MAGDKLPAPDGTRPMMISMREMDTLGLKTGSGLRETVPYQVFNKGEILTQIAQIGFMCPFHEFRNEISKLQGDDLLIVADPNEVYGENWLLCLTRKAYETQMELLQQRERERLEELVAQEKAASGAGEDDLSSIVYEDRPVLARPWVSSTARDTHEDVAALTITSSRQLIKMSVTKMSDEFNADYKFSDRDADQLGFAEWRQHKDPNYELTRLEQEIGLQGIPPLVDNATQTSWFRSVNSALQYEPIVMEPRRRQDEMDHEKMQAFLDRVLPLVEEALQQNETLDIFLDPFANLVEEDATLSNKNENAIKEVRSFTDLVYSKNKTLPAIDWHPKKNGVIAVAAAANVNFMKRLDLLDKIDSSFVLIWNFVDLIHPQLMLEAPQDVLTMRFNPSQPHLVAGGLYNGQVVVWDYSKAEHAMSKTKASKGGNSTGTKRTGTTGGADQDDTPKAIPPVKPLYISYIDASHRRPVADLMWLPAGMEVNNRGHVVATQDTTVHQFVTIAGDGQVCFWDLRFKDPKYRGLTRTKLEKGVGGGGSGSGGAPKDALPEVQFIPIYSIALTKLETAGELGLNNICLERPKDDSTGATTTTTTLSSRFYCGTEEGEFLYADWRPHAAGTATTTKSSSAHHDDGDDGGSGSGSGGGGVEYVQWLCRDHFRATVAVCVSPFFSSIFLTVSEANFHIWNVSQVSKTSETNGPIFSSPLSLAALTCAAFSPTRPAVIYIGKADGMLEVWDFMDQSHRASLSIGVTACALTSIEFRPHVSTSTNAGTASASAGSSGAGSAGGKHTSSGATSGKTGAGAGAASSVPGAAGGGGANLNVKQQLVAIGDQIGNLHIMEIPRTLSRASSGERQVMEAYFKRESERMKATREAVQLQQQQSNGQGHGQRGNDTFAPKTAASGDRDKATATTSGPVDDELFKQMEAEFCRELGIDTTQLAPAS